MNSLEQRKLITGPYQVAVDITNNCNYRCLHCYNSSGDNNVISDELTDEQFLQLFKDIGKMKPFNVCFCGGEPLLKLELMLQCADVLYKSGVNNIATVSNGYYLTNNVAKQLKDHHFSRVQISLDGSNKNSCFDLRRNENAFDKAVAALKILKKHNLNPNIAFCPTKNNINELDEVYNICKEIGVDEIRIQPLMNIGRASSNIEKILPNKQQYIKLIANINKLKKLYYIDKIRISWGDPLDHIYRYRNVKDIFSVMMNIKANGAIDVSPYLPINVGNVKRHSIIEYWNAGLYNCWALKEVQDMSNDLYCVSKMDEIEGYGKTWIDEDVEFDIIDDKIQLEVLA